MSRSPVGVEDLQRLSKKKYTPEGVVLVTDVVRSFLLFPRIVLLIMSEYIVFVLIHVRQWKRCRVSWTLVQCLPWV